MTDLQTRPDKTLPDTSLRAAFVPVWIALGVLALATMLWGIRAASTPVPAIIAVAVVTAIALLIVRPRGRAATYTVIAASLWATMWSVYGASWFLLALWATLTGITGIPWWKARYVPNTGPAPAQEAQEDPVPEFPAELVVAAGVVDRWVEHVAGDGPLKGTMLELLKTDGRVHQFTVRFIPGKHTYSQLTAQREAIASAMDVPDVNVTIEKARTAASAIVTIITDIEDRPPVMYPGPRFNPETGLVGIGEYDDDRTEASLSIIATNGSFGALFCGDQGSGKSACMEQVALSLIASGYFVGLYVDPQGGMSSPALVEACKWSATSVAEAATLIRQLPRWRRLRQAVFSRQKRNGYTLSKEHPVVLVILDEFHEIACGLSKDDQQTLVNMSKTLRKVGGALFVGTQNVGVQAFGGNNDLRTQLMSRNVVYFYTSSKQQGNLSGRNEFDPTTLPEGTPGYGYLKAIRVDGKLITRAAPFRAYYLGGKNDFGGRDPGLAWLDRLQANYEFADLPRAEAGALGAAFARRDEAQARASAAEEAFIAACEAVGRGELDPEKLLDFDPDAKPKDTAPTPGLGLPSMRLGGPDEEDTDRYPEKTQAILEALRAGAWGTAEITRRATVTVSTSHIEQQLPRLIEERQVTKVATGHYHAVGYEEKCERPGCGG